MRNLRRYLSFLAPAAMLLACGDSAAEYRLGMAGPFEEGFGIANKRGAELALEQINAGGGIDGQQLVIEFRDDGGDGSRAATIAQEFVDDERIAAVVGHVTSGAMVAASKVYDGQLTALATTASSAELTGISRWVFRVISSDSANGADLARFADRMGKRRALVLYENDAYGRGLADAFRSTFRGEVLGFDPIDGSGGDAEAFVAWALARRADLVFVAGTERSGMALLRQARAQGLTADFLGGDGWTGVVADRAASEGALVGAPFTSLDPRPEAQRFVEAFRAKYNEDPDGNAALAYDAVQVMAAGLRAVGPDRAKLRDWLGARTTRDPLRGVTGAIAFQLTGDPIGKSLTMTRVRGGALVPVEESR
ncbi:MAG: ABC transporter substrate-binding protein [Gemmatimonadaceae bacterium]|nr:ABC transporter substrate-binding protein [Gemmatimonadaceae bacterium]MCW5826621.1 ABC transporter substrate-binding protein [Gemmatimonadaceae bacterium]